MSGVRFPIDDTGGAYGSRYEPRLTLLDQTSTLAHWGVARPGDSTRRGSHWQTPPNPAAGVQESEWLAAHLHELTSYAGMWIAIKRNKILASSESVDDVIDWLVAQHVVDALVSQVPADVTAERYMAI